jgi:predicted dehydrogenase
MNRRDFLKGSLAVAGAAVMIGGTKASGQIIGANERFRIAVAGVNSRGGAHIQGYLGQPNVEIAYIADPDSNVRKRVMASLAKKVAGKYETKGIADIRQALEDKTLDAVSIATPNHWHSLMAIWACQAGKHVYVEKPMCHDNYVGRRAMDAWKKYGVVVQHGTQQRSEASVAGLTEAIRAGKWGKLVVSHGYCCKPRGGIGVKPVEPAPPELDWNIWRGPANIPDDGFHKNFVHYNWHWFWVTGNGDLNNQGTHQLDVAIWALGDRRQPKSAMALGGRFAWDDQGETPNSMLNIIDYGDGQYMFFTVRNVNYKGYKQQVENEFYFEDGGKIIKGMYYPKDSDKGEKVSVPAGKVTPGNPFGSFVTACRAGKQEMSNAPADVAYYSCLPGHLGNISYRLGKKVAFSDKAVDFGENKLGQAAFENLHEILKDGVKLPAEKTEYTVGPLLNWDGQKECFTGDNAEDANKINRNVYRKGFEVPETV